MIAPASNGRRLIARDDELETLVSLRRSAAQSRGALVLVEGEAGIGKTRLVSAFRETLRTGRAAVGVARCREFGNVPYGPVQDALRAVGAVVQAGAARDRIEYLADLHGALVAATELRLVVLVIEDIQWADDGSLRFLAHTLPSLASLRALIVATYRTEQSGSDSGAGPYIARFSGNAACRRIALDPLAPRDVRRMLAAERSAESVDLDEIVERSEGNPFFAEELLKDALAQRTPDGARALPFTIRGLVEERLLALDERTRRIIALAAVIGRTFDAAFLAQLANVRAEHVLRALRRARELHLIEELSGQPSRFAFRHGLTREAIYDAMLVAETRALHARILAALAVRAGARVQDLGYHAWAAGDAAACVRYNEAAGDEAHALHAYPDAVRCYERALAGADRDDATARLLRKSAAAWESDGDARRAAECYESAAQASQRAGDAAGAVDDYQQMSRQARIGGGRARATAILERTIRMFSPHEARLRAKLELTLAHLHLDRGDLAAAREILARHDAASDLPAFHNVRTYLATVSGDPDGLRAATARYIAACAAQGGESGVSGRFNEPFGLAVLGYDEEALAKLDALLPELRERRMRSLEVLACANAALVLARTGRLDEARARVEAGLAVPEPATTGPIALASAALGIAIRLDDARLVARSLSPAIVESAFASGINSTLGRFAGPYARWLAMRGDEAEAAAVLRRAMSLIGAPFAASETLLAAVELGDPWTRRRALDLLPAIDAMAHVPLYAATARHLRALAHRATGDAAQRSCALDAAERYAELGWPLLEAAALALGGETGAAAQRYAAAGATWDARRLRAASGAGTASSGLSERQREIARLVARGTSNASLAERFAVNRRTVEKHLTSIYGKLGVRNRSELAAVIARSELG